MLTDTRTPIMLNVQRHAIIDTLINTLHTDYNSSPTYYVMLLIGKLFIIFWM